MLEHDLRLGDRGHLSQTPGHRGPAPKAQRMSDVKRLLAQPLLDGLIAATALKNDTDRGRQHGRETGRRPLIPSGIGGLRQILAQIPPRGGQHNWTFREEKPAC